MNLLTMLLPALVPVVADGVRGLFARFTHGAGAQPQSVDEAIRLMEAQTARVAALAQLDQLSPAASSWVANLRGAFRYVAVGGIVIAGVGAQFVADVPLEARLLLLDLTGASMSFIIGERMYLGIRK